MAEKEKPKKRRQRSRGKKRNPKTAAAHATNSLESAAGIENNAANDSTTPHHPDAQNIPPELFAPGPATEALDGNTSINKDLLMIKKMMNHGEWQIPEYAFKHLPQNVLSIALNIGKTKGGGHKIGAGGVPVKEQLAASKMVKEYHDANLKKYTAIKTNELKVLNVQQTTVTTADQRFAIIAGLAAELSRRQSGGAMANQPVGRIAGNSDTGGQVVDGSIADPNES